jgi:hypothetical protein
MAAFCIGTSDKALGLRWREEEGRIRGVGRVRTGRVEVKE